MENAKLKIDLKALYNNARFLLEETGGGVIATVKNNAYNFGLERAVNTFYEAGIRNFATTSLKEAIKIRELYENVYILMLNPSDDFDTLRKYRISSSIANLDWLKTYKDDMKDISWHLEWSGMMRRSGCRSEDEFMEALDFAQKNDIAIDGIWTHFSWADEFDKNNSYEEEKENWLNIEKKACEKYDFKFIHAQNSASFCRDCKLPEHSHVRVGIILYGCPGYENWEYQGKIQHAIEVSAEVIAINDLLDGQSIGYCSSFIASKDSSISQDGKTHVAVINIGYGDGILRKRVIGHDVEINSKRYPLVSMMMSHTVALVDQDVKIGDKVYFYKDTIPVFEFTYKGVGANSEQISALNFNSIDVEYVD